MDDGVVDDAWVLQVEDDPELVYVARVTRQAAIAKVETQQIDVVGG